MNKAALSTAFLVAMCGVNTALAAPVLLAISRPVLLVT